MAKSFVPWVTAAVLAAAVGTPEAQSPDAVAAAPEIHRVVVDNQYVRVLETRFVAGQRVTVHAHPARVVVVLDHSRTRVTSTDGKAEIVDHKLGDVFWSDPTAHSARPGMQDLLEPALGLVVVTLRAMAITAGMVGIDPLPAVIALLYVAPVRKR